MALTCLRLLLQPLCVPILCGIRPVYQPARLSPAPTTTLILTQISVLA